MTDYVVGAKVVCVSNKGLKHPKRPDQCIPTLGAIYTISAVWKTSIALEEIPENVTYHKSRFQSYEEIMDIRI
jgi:hypothetical protein